MQVRLQKYLAEAGIASRRQAERLILAGEVLVNGRVAELGMQVEPEKDKVTWRGKEVTQQEKIYLMLNKPIDVVTTVRDTHGRTTVLDLLPADMARIYPVGRLDKDSEGLLLLTNDGDLAYKLTHPKFEVVKTYHALVSGHPSAALLTNLAAGIVLADGPTALALVEVLHSDKQGSWLSIGIHEGRNRQVRRMLKAIGHPVLHLRREAFGNLNLGRLQVGEWRLLQTEELAELRQQAARLKL